MPWNDQKGGDRPTGSGGPWGSGSENDDKNGGSPWNRPGGGGQGGGNDLEDQMRRMQERFRRGRGGGDGKGRGGGGRGIGPFGLMVIGFVALLAWLFSGVVVVDEQERAAVFRFGEWQTNFGPGFHIHLPTPIETHEILPAEIQQDIRIGTNASESLMLTGDENIVDVQFSVFWKLHSVQPEDFILNVKDGEILVQAAAESVMREVVGKSNLEDIITTERNEIQQQVKLQTQALLDDYRAGVEILDVQILEALAPPQVNDAFLDVVNAGQDATTKINEATQYANEIVPRARGAAQQLLQEAEAYREQVIADATGEASRFNQIYEEYRKAPRVTRERMYLETMERVLGRTDKIILDSDSGTVPYLPLDRVNRNEGR